MVPVGAGHADLGAAVFKAALEQPKSRISLSFVVSVNHGVFGRGQLGAQTLCADKEVFVFAATKAECVAEDRPGGRDALQDVTSRQDIAG